MAPQYKTVADDLRARLEAEEWDIGDRIPGISELQEQYGIRSLSTIRQAQQLLVQEGLLRTEQGRGAFVVAHRKPLADDADRPDAASDRRYAVLGDTIATTSSDGTVHLSVPAGTAVTVQTRADYFTPREVIRSVVELLLGSPSGLDAAVTDPAVGSGGFLIEAYRSLLDQHAACGPSREVHGDAWRELGDYLMLQASRADVRDALADKLAEKLGWAA